MDFIPLIGSEWASQEPDWVLHPVPTMCIKGDVTDYGVAKRKPDYGY